MWNVSGEKRLMSRSKSKIKGAPVFKYFFVVAQQPTSGLGSLVEDSKSHTPRHRSTHPVGLL
jgi:hypothetical protein